MSNHHQMIQSLVSEIRALREQISELENQSGDTEVAYCYAEESARNSKRIAENARYEAEEERRNAEYQKWEYQSAIDRLERAKRYENEYEERRAIEALKRLR